MASTKELKQRIRGTKSTGKITRAMEMISAVKMRKAVARVVAIRPYAQSALRVLAQVSQSIREDEHALFQSRSLRRVLCVVVTSNRGLCGSFNAQVIREVKQEVKRLEGVGIASDAIEFVSLGKKGDRMLRQCEGAIHASFPDALDASRSDALRSIVQLIREEYTAGHYDKVMLVYTDYVSPLVQKTRLRRLLPLSSGALQDEVSEMLHSSTLMYEETVPQKSASPDQKSGEYTIEPSPEAVLETMIPRLMEIQLFHAVLESNASQEAARMMAMRNATDAAKDMVEEFTLSYNQLRQAKVTQEIAELSAGMAAVSG